MNNIGVKGIDALANLDKVTGVEKKEKTGEGFANYLKQSIDKVNALQMEADKAAQDLLTGKEVNLHQVMIAMEKANISFQLMVQVRNKVIDAYREMMRMQV